MANVKVDDLDNTVHNEKEGVEVLTWHFAFGPEDGMKTYTIDLTAENYEKLTEALGPFVEAGDELQRHTAPRTIRRASSGTAAKKPGGAVTKGGKTMDEVRQALRAEGHEVADRGRLSQEMREKYEYHTKDTFK